MMKFKEAKAKALAAGASEADIERYRAAIKRGNSGPRPMVRAMIVALQISPWRNSADDWARLAGALAR